ncbi:MAG: hypothetical protein ACK4NS_01030 [Saprospiraceae bacterium]
MFRIKRAAALKSLFFVFAYLVPELRLVSQPLPEADLMRSMRSASQYAARTLIAPQGYSRCDYDWTRGEWSAYEPAWHTGQVIWGLLEAWRLTGDTAAWQAALRAGRWWRAQRIEGGRLDGFFNAIHGAEVGELINFTTIADGTPGIFLLSRLSGDPSYANVAVSAGRWAMAHLWIPERGLMYDLIDPVSGEVLRDRSPHFPSDRPLGIRDVARPNTEGFLYADMFRHTGDSTFLRFFLRQCDTLAALQSANGFWMDFHPNNREKQRIHPRFNIWYAESLMVAWQLSGERRYLEAALRTARALKAWPKADGAVYYLNRPDGSYDPSSVCGSAVAFMGILWLRLRAAGYGEFDEDIHRAARWICANQFADTHPDPNLRGAYFETWTKKSGLRTQIFVRDIATAFGLRFMADYWRAFYEK